MMGVLANQPAWGLLVRAPLDSVREILSSFDDAMLYRTSDGWTAGFYMDPLADTSDNEATDLLVARGFVPVFRFDFSRYVFSSWRWDGESWDLLYKGDQSLDARPDLDEAMFVDPTTILGGVGILAPFQDPEVNPPPPRAAVEVRMAMVIEGASVEQARQVAGSGVRVEPGPRGAVVFSPDLETRFAFWERAPGRVLELEFYPESGEFWYRIMKGEDCLGTFRPGETRSWDGAPFLASVDGETDPATIVEKLGIPRLFVAPNPGARAAPAT